MTDGCPDLLASVRGGRVDFVYSDPPWGDGNLKYWQTVNKKMTGAEPRSVNCDAFLRTFMSIVHRACTPEAVVFVEYGQRWRNKVTDLAREFGLHVLAITQPVYGSDKRPLDLFTMMFKPGVEVPANYVGRVCGTTGFKTLLAAAGPFIEARSALGLGPAQVLDPCCGLGYTARLAVRYGMTFYGNELNAKRLEKTVAVLERDPRKDEVS